LVVRDGGVALQVAPRPADDAVQPPGKLDTLLCARPLSECTGEQPVGQRAVLGERSECRLQVLLADAPHVLLAWLIEVVRFVSVGRVGITGPRQELVALSVEVSPPRVMTRVEEPLGRRPANRSVASRLVAVATAVVTVVIAMASVSRRALRLEVLD